MRKVADNVYGSFGNKLGLVVVTHEHWDHISGFQHASRPLPSTSLINCGWHGRIRPTLRANLCRKSFQRIRSWLPWRWRPDPGWADELFGPLGA